MAAIAQSGRRGSLLLRQWSRQHSVFSLFQSMMGRSLILLSGLISGCVVPNAWKMDGIVATDPSVASTRLRYVSLTQDTPLSFELLRSGDLFDSYLNLHQFTWRPSQVVSVVFQMGDQEMTEELPLLQGKMRLKISPELTEKIILTLQQGQKVGILADGFEMTLEPDMFARTYNRFLGKRALFQNIFKGPME